MADTEEEQIVEEERGEEEEAQPAEAQAESTAVAKVEEPEAPKERLKIVITYSDRKAIIGVKADDTDPIYTIQEGDLSDVLVAVMGDVEAAREAWKGHKLYPKATVPAPSSTPKPVVATTARSTARSATRSATKPDEKKPSLQPSFDL
jgi:hypothetical protein